MPSEQHDLIEAILHRPSDDGPRLVYADWLDEHGVPIRANFIRVQCALASLECGAMPNPSLPVYRDLERKYWEAKDDSDEWILPNGTEELFPAGRHETIPQDHHRKARVRNILPLIIWRRGFIHTISATLSRLRAILPALVRQHPIAEVIPTDRFPQAETVKGRTRYRWNAADRNRRSLLADPSEIPDECVIPGLHRDFSQPDDALNALSKALIRDARRPLQPC